MSGDADIVRACFSELAINEDGSYSPRRVEAETALAHLAACEAQRDALVEALERIADPSAELARHREDLACGRRRTAAVPFEIARAALAEAATHEETP